MLEILTGKVGMMLFGYCPSLGKRKTAMILRVTEFPNKSPRLLLSMAVAVFAAFLYVVTRI